MKYGNSRFLSDKTERGAAKVAARTFDEKGKPNGFRMKDGKPEEIEIKMGESLVEEVIENWISDDTHRENPLPFSKGVKRYFADAGTTMKDVLAEFGIGEDGLGRISVNRFLTNTGLRPLFSPVVEDGIRLGLNQIAPFWEGLIARNVGIDRLNYEYYVFDNSTAQDAEFELRNVGQGAAIPVAKVVVSGKSYALTKTGRGIEWTDESKMAPLDLAAMWFQQLGIKLGWFFHDIAVDRLLNGYFADLSDAAPTMATAAGGVLAEKDLFNAQATHLVDYGYQSTVMLANKTNAVNIKTMTYGTGAPVFPDGVEAKGLPPLAIARTLPSNRIIFVDTNFALIRLEAKPFGTEFERQVKTQTEGSYGSEISLIVPMFKDARLVVTI